MTMTIESDASDLLSGWYPGLLYLPGPTCAAYISGDDRRSLLRTANQLGKTCAAAKRMDTWCIDHPGKRFGCLIADLQNHYSEVCAKIHEVITGPELDPSTHYIDGRGYYIHGSKGIKYKNGTRVLFRSGKGPLQGLESFSVDAAWIDEVPARGHYNAFVRGVHGPIWVSFTPIGRDPKWFRSKVEGDPETGEKPEETWTQYVAELSHVECPWRTPEQIAEMIAKTDPYERAQRIRAEWEGPAHGRRFTAFAAHSVTTEDMPADSWATVSADHGEGAGKEFILLFQWDSKRVVVTDEYVNQNATRPNEDARNLVAILTRRGVPFARIKRIVGDANSAGKGNVGESVNSMLAKGIAHHLGMPPTGVHIHLARKGKGSVAYGEQVVNVAFDARELYVHERCRRLVHCLRHHQGTKGPREETKDGIDALRYGATEVLCHSGRPSRSLYAGGPPLAQRGGWG